MTGTTALLFSLDIYGISYKKLLLKLKMELVLPHHKYFVIQNQAMLSLWVFPVDSDLEEKAG